MNTPKHRWRLQSSGQINRRGIQAGFRNKGTLGWLGRRRYRHSWLSIGALVVLSTVMLTSCASTAEAPPLGSSSLSENARGLSILAVGDSHAVSFAKGMADVGGEKNRIINGAFGGCGIMKPSKYKLTTYGLSEALDANHACDDWARKWSDLVAQNNPNAVVLTTSYWDANEQIIDGSGAFLKITDNAFHSKYVEYMNQAIDILSSNGARVYLDNSYPDLGHDPVVAKKMSETVTNDVYAPARAKGKNVALLPLHEQVCSHEECPKSISGIQVLDETGHPAGQSLTRLSTWMLSVIANDLKENRDR